MDKKGKEITEETLRSLEVKYGGHVTNIPYLVRSPLDGREYAPTVYCEGGDRFLPGKYGKVYAEWLPRCRRGLLVEVGILRGTGLAVFSEFFDTVIGLDIDIRNFDLQWLMSLGAFKKVPEVYRYDQFLDGTRYLGALLNGRKVNVVVDDGNHCLEANLMTFESFLPHLEDWVYFVEDNMGFYPAYKKRYSFPAEQYGRITVIDGR